MRAHQLSKRKRCRLVGYQVSDSHNKAINTVFVNSVTLLINGAFGHCSIERHLKNTFVACAIL